MLVLLTATASIKSSQKDRSCLYPHTHFYQYTYIVIDSRSAQAVAVAEAHMTLQIGRVAIDVI